MSPLHDRLSVYRRCGHDDCACPCPCFRRCPRLCLRVCGGSAVTAQTVSVVLFDGFEVLDVFGPVELFSHVPGWTVRFLGPVAGGPVRAAQGVTVTTESGLSDLTADGETTDILLVPGGPGTRRLVGDAGFLDLLRTTASRAGTVASVCTGSALLAAAGLLEGRRATSNKRAWDWVTSQGIRQGGELTGRVDWVARARWVADGNLWTSSGVAAGTDMAHALIADREGLQVADSVAADIELEVHRDPGDDPFAVLHGLV